MGAGKTTSHVEMSASAPKVPYGATVTFSGTLTASDGSLLAGRGIRTYVREGTGSWEDGPVATTGPDGSFSLSYEPAANVTLVAVFNGDDTRWGSESDDVRVGVAPALTLTTEGGAVDGTGVAHFPAGTTEIGFSGTVAPPHKGYPIGINIRKLQEDGTYAPLDEGSARGDASGNFFFDWSLPATELAGGSYRAYAVFRKDKDHARGLSPAVSFVIDPQP
jgi:hypothetical protein